VPKDDAAIQAIVDDVLASRAKARHESRLSGPEAQSVERTVLAKAAVYSSANPRVDDFDMRSAMASQFYSYGQPRLPYFTPITPVVTDAKAYRDDLNTTMEWYQAQGVKFRVQIGDIHVMQSGDMAVSVGMMSTVLTYPDGSSERSPSRWTVVLRKEGGTWVSVHEHLSFYNEEDQLDPIVNTYRAEIPKLRSSLEAQK
jgi:ketosteroid isomerase-like protein